MVEMEWLRSGEAKGVKDEERVEENTMTNFRVFLAGENFDDLEIVFEIAWGSAALVCLFKGLTACAAPSVSTLAGYMTLLQIWIHHHFPMLCERLEDERYDETMPAANRYSPRGGD
ncbi:hypothetical protein P8452_28618 [Trifolium repens]|nr:hypothetical protein P8452_28618 [Trifolium repens]